MKCVILAALGLCVSGSVAGVTRGAVVNGDFELGTLSGWTVMGAGSVQTAALGITPPAGTYQGFIETTGNYTALAPAVVASLGVPGSAIIGLGAGTPTNGTGISQSITVSAGDVLTYDWNFISDELNETATYNDFAFLTISGSAYLLASRNSSVWDWSSPPAGFDGQTNWATGTYTFASAGTYTIGFGVLNVGDSGHNSALLLDSVGIAVPEPGLAPVLSLAGMAMLYRRRR